LGWLLVGQIDANGREARRFGQLGLEGLPARRRVALRPSLHGALRRSGPSRTSLIGQQRLLKLLVASFRFRRSADVQSRCTKNLCPPVVNVRVGFNEQPAVQRKGLLPTVARQAVRRP
jgi:hypothetical protein